MLDVHSASVIVAFMCPAVTVLLLAAVFWGDT